MTERDKYVREFVADAFQIVLAMLAEDDRGKLVEFTAHRADDRDWVSTRFTLTARPDVVFLFRRGVYTEGIDPQMSPQSAASVLMGSLMERFHQPRGEPVDGVVDLS